MAVDRGQLYDYGRPRKADCDYCGRNAYTWECGVVVVREAGEQRLVREKRICGDCIREALKRA